MGDLVALSPDPRAWLVTTAWRKHLDAVRSDAARRGREQRTQLEPAPGPASETDDTLRAVGGLTTRQIADAYLVPEATMAQRISRAKRAVAGARWDRPGGLATVLRVLYLVFNEGYCGDVDLTREAIRLTRQLAAVTDEVEVAGLLALMLLHQARRPARTRPDGALVPLAEQDRSRWDTALIAEEDGDLATAARQYVEAARAASNSAEREHLTRQAARLNQRLRG